MDTSNARKQQEVGLETEESVCNPKANIKIGERVPDFILCGADGLEHR
jgi:hypothetical protein